MTELPTVADNQTLIAEERRSSRQAAVVIVSASALANHFGVSRQYVSRLADDGVIERLASGFDIDLSRLRYLGWLRAPERRATKNEAASELSKARIELIQLRIAEKRRELISLDEANATIDQICGLVLTKLGGMAARCTRDLQVRRNIDNVVFEIRTEIADAAQRLADQCGAPSEPEEIDGR
jgi:hypothetical protein